MAELKKDWITEGLIDFEYKKYQLLAYLKRVRERFVREELYPELSDLVMHLRNLKQIRDQKKLLFEQFPKKISRIDFEKLQLSYEQILEDDEMMKEIYQLIDYAMPRLEDNIRIGKEIHEKVEDELALEVVGVLPLYDNEGYLFLGSKQQKALRIFRYRANIITSGSERFRAINTQFMGTEERGIVNTMEHIKLRLVRANREMPNPATYAIMTENAYPLSETLLPVAKRLLIRQIRFAA